jgi:biotin carboxylase
VVGVDSSSGRRRLLVIGAGPAQSGLLRAARARRLFVVACDRDPEAVGFEYADARFLVSTEDETGIEEVARQERVDGLIAPGIDWPVALAARIARRLGLPHPVVPDVAATAVSKLRQRERLDEAGLPQPRWRAVTSADGGAELPCVVKPPDRQGQVAVTLVRDRAELQPALERALVASRSGVALVEEPVEGPEVTVNAFSVGGRFHPLTVTDRLTAEPPAFGVALAHAWPSAQASETAVEAARLATEALGIVDGPTYTQLRFALDGGPRVIELAARLGGGHDAELCEVALGIDLNGLALAAALGEPIAPRSAASSGLSLGNPRLAGGACVRFLVAPEGTLERVDGVDRAASGAGIVETVVYRRPGWRFVRLRQGADRAGYVLARGDSRDDALARAAAAADRVRFAVARD